MVVGQRPNAGGMEADLDRTVFGVVLDTGHQKRQGLSEPFLERWLPRIGLPHVPGELSLPGQVVPGEICNQNAKHYQ